MKWWFTPGDGGIARLGGFAAWTTRYFIDGCVDPMPMHELSVVEAEFHNRLPPAFRRPSSKNGQVEMSTMGCQWTTESVCLLSPRAKFAEPSWFAKNSMWHTEADRPNMFPVISGSTMYPSKLKIVSDYERSLEEALKVRYQTDDFVPLLSYFHWREWPVDSEAFQKCNKAAAEGSRHSGLPRGFMPSSVLFQWRMGTALRQTLLVCCSGSAWPSVARPSAPKSAMSRSAACDSG